jgi:hypothetical protein
MMLIELEEGPKYYEPLISKQDAKLWASLFKIHGEKAEEQLDKFVNSLFKQSQTLVFIPKVSKNK